MTGYALSCCTRMQCCAPVTLSCDHHDNSSTLREHAARLCGGCQGLSPRLVPKFPFQKVFGPCLRAALGVARLPFLVAIGTTSGATETETTRCALQAGCVWAGRHGFQCSTCQQSKPGMTKADMTSAEHVNN